MAKFVKQEKIREKWSAAKEGSRRVSSIVSHLAKHHKLTLGTSTQDPAYNAALADFTALHDTLNAARTQANSYLTAVRTMCFAVCEIGDAFAATVDSADVQTRQAYLEISGLGNTLDQRVRRDMESQFLDRVIGPLEALLADMQAVKADVRRREALKREYDHYYFKVRSLKEKGSEDPRKLQRNEEKLEQHTGPLQDCTGNLMRIFQSYQANKHLLMREPFLAFRAVQQRFMREMADRFADLAAQPSAEPVALETFEPYDGSAARPASVSSVSGAGAGAGAAAAGSASPQRSYRDRLVAFYSHYNPSKVGEVDEVLAKFAGHEEHMFRVLADKYGPEPAAGGAVARAPLAAAPPFAPVGNPGAGVGKFGQVAGNNPADADPVAAPSGKGGTKAEPSANGPELLDAAETPVVPSAPMPAATAAAGASANGVGVDADPCAEASGPLWPAPPTPGSAPALLRARALYDYAAQDSDEMSLEEGVEIEVLEQRPDGWWRGRVGSAEGLFPGNFVEALP